MVPVGTRRRVLTIFFFDRCEVKENAGRLGLFSGAATGHVGAKDKYRHGRNWQTPIPTRTHEDLASRHPRAKEGFSDVLSFPSSDHSGQRGSGTDCASPTRKCFL